MFADGDDLSDAVMLALNLAIAVASNANHQTRMMDHLLPNCLP
jgi:hypothetical protein